jgi:proline dehydrogenase
MDELVASGIERNVSLKLSQLGASVDRATCIDNLRRVLEAADRHAFFVRIDMENSPYTALTLEVFETVWQQGHRNVGVALQACLHRTPGDVVRMNQLGARVRLVKGAYKEPATVAHQRKADVDEAFVTLACGLLDGGTYPAIATHDVAMLDRVKAYAAQQRIDRSRYEFQMLFGVRRDLQDALAADGYRMRIYLPFGRQWFPYFMRRLGERPANLSFVIRSLIHERRAS